VVTDDDRPVPTVSPELAAASKPSKLHSLAHRALLLADPVVVEDVSGLFPGEGVGRPGASVRR